MVQNKNNTNIFVFRKYFLERAITYWFPFQKCSRYLVVSIYVYGSFDNMYLEDLVIAEDHHTTFPALKTVHSCQSTAHTDTDSLFNMPFEISGVCLSADNRSFFNILFSLFQMKFAIYWISVL